MSVKVPPISAAMRDTWAIATLSQIDRVLALQPRRGLEPIRPEGPELIRLGPAGDQIADQSAGDRAQRQAEMAVPERQKDIVVSRHARDHRQRIRQGWPESHPS